LRLNNIGFVNLDLEMSHCRVPTASRANHQCLGTRDSGSGILGFEEGDKLGDAVVVPDQRSVKRYWNNRLSSNKSFPSLHNDPQFLESLARIRAAKARFVVSSDESKSTNGLTPSKCAITDRIWTEQSVSIPLLDQYSRRNLPLSARTASSFKLPITQFGSLVCRMLTNNLIPSACTNAYWNFSKAK